MRLKLSQETEKSGSLETRHRLLCTRQAATSPTLMLAPTPVVTMDCGMITSKTVLLLLSVIFLAAGATLGFVGGRFISSYEDFDAFFRDEQILLPAIIIIIVAGVMLFLGVTGCFVTIKESQIGLRFFLAILLLMFITEAAAFVLGFIYREKVVAEVQETMDELFQTYGKEKPKTEMVDFWQSQFQCCGVKNYTDWVNRDWFNRTGNSSVPRSCCKQEFKNCSGLLSEPQELNTVGCAGVMELRIKELINYFMIFILGFAVVKFFGMLSILVIACRQEENGYRPLNSGVYA